ncbi:MAG: hypothetical protein J0I17_09040 ['Candidatus Kapabacteria' thiocyanatum]|nr:hypothetical protein ['Candidatus Kapabacteria' thiocyanatum]
MIKIISLSGMWSSQEHEQSVLLLTETFEPPGTPDRFSHWDEDAWLQETLDERASMEASTPTVSGGTTIAGHTEHLRFFLRFVHERMKGGDGSTDWTRAGAYVK